MQVPASLKFNTKRPALLQARISNTFIRAIQGDFHNKHKQHMLLFTEQTAVQHCTASKGDHSKKADSAKGRSTEVPGRAQTHSPS